MEDWIINPLEMHKWGECTALAELLEDIFVSSYIWEVLYWNSVSMSPEETLI